MNDACRALIAMRIEREQREALAARIAAASPPRECTIEHLIDAETKIIAHPGPVPRCTVMKRRTLCLIQFWTATGTYSSMEEARGMSVMR